MTQCQLLGIQEIYHLFLETVIGFQVLVHESVLQCCFCGFFFEGDRRVYGKGKWRKGEMEEGDAGLCNQDVYWDNFCLNGEAVSS